MNKDKLYETIISPDQKLMGFHISEILNSKDLLFLLIKRDFIAKYKQTVLGPSWFFLQPVLQTLVLSVVFNKIAKLSTDGIPPILFYLSGITMWNYFSQCLIATSNTFVANAGLFGKVYFPRAIIPISIVISNLIQFTIGLTLFLAIYLYYWYSNESFTPNALILLLPLLIGMTGLLGLGIGMLISSVTTKYRDLQHLLTFGVQLLMYATPVIVPLSEIPNRYRKFIELNPVTGIIETFKASFFGHDLDIWWPLLYSLIFTLVISTMGLIVFNRTEKNFMDTV